MADISLIDPYSAQQESIARQRRMAQALQQQAQSPMETPQMPGVLISPYAGLAKVLQGIYGGYQEAEADKEYKNLVNEARTNQAEDFAKVIGALKAPGQEAIAGQEASDFVPASYTPERVSTANYARTVIPEKFTPAIRSKPAIAPQDAREAGYIGPDLIASLKDPAMRQFAMAQAMAKLEPKAPISVAAGGTLLDPRTFKPVFTAPAAPQRGVAVGQGQELRDPITGALLATGPAKDAKATEPKWEATVQKINGVDTPGWINVNAGAEAASTFVAGGKPEKIAAHWEATTHEVDGKPVAGWINLNAADKAASFVAGAKPAEAKAVAPVWKEVARGGKIYYENFNETDPAKRQAGAIEKEAVKTPPHYSEIEKNGNVVIVDMNLSADQRLANAQIKGPIRNNLEKIETNDENGKPVTRYVDKTQLATLGDIPGQYKGFMSDMAEAGQLPKNWQSIPEIAGLVRENLINKAGGITPKDLANLKVRIAEAASRLAYEGVSGFSAANLTPQLSNFTTLSSGSPAPAVAAAPKAAVRTLSLPTDKSQLINGQTYQTRNGPARWDAALGQFVQ